MSRHYNPYVVDLLTELLAAAKRGEFMDLFVMIGLGGEWEDLMDVPDTDDLIFALQSVRLRLRLSTERATNHQPH